MHLASIFPITDPTWIFFLVLCIILFAPILLNRLRIPHIVGMLLAGVIIGPHGLDILQRDSSFEIFGNVGLLYIMFLAGVEIDLADFSKNRNKSFVFGFLTFALPFALGAFSFRYGIGMEWSASLLIASMFSSHTLVSYAIVSRYGLSHNRSVNIAVGGTIITDTLSLLVLAIISRLIDGENDLHFWIVMVISITAFITSVLYFFPRIARFFFRRITDQVQQFIFVMAMLFLAAIGAHIAGLEGILGAFLAGLVLNRLIPVGSPLMGRIEFIGNALFIPYFLIGVGMLIDMSVFLEGANTMVIALLMTVLGTLGKYIAAWMSQKIYRLRAAERTMIFGLSAAHAAGTLAVVMVGFELHLFNEEVLNGTLIFILVSCIVSSMQVEKASSQLVLIDELSGAGAAKGGDDEKIMIPMSANQNVEYLMQTAMMMRNPKLNRGLIGLNVLFDYSSRKQIEEGRKCLQHAEKIATAADVRMQTQSRLATNLSNGIIHALRENDASELILGLHKKENNKDSFFGPVILGLLGGCSRQLILLRCTMPPNTLRRIHLHVPPKAEYEAGFLRWVDRLSRMAGILGCRIVVHAQERTWNILSAHIQKLYPNIRIEFVNSVGNNELKRMANEVNDDHLLVLVSARKGSVSYQPSFEQLPDLISRYYSHVSLMIIYPDEYTEENRDISLFDTRTTDSHTGYETQKGWLTTLMERYKQSKQ